VRPASFDLDRHASLHTVYFKKKDHDAPEALEVRATRSDGEFWFLKFKGMTTPEAVGHLSGGMLFIPAEERLELPADMVYVSDVPGMRVVDENGQEIGTVKEVLDQGAQDILVVQGRGKEILIPWNDNFVRRVDQADRLVSVDLSALRDIL
jgi:16S rRNA processing protein RimM